MSTTIKRTTDRTTETAGFDRGKFVAARYLTTGDYAGMYDLLHECIERAKFDSCHYEQGFIEGMRAARREAAAS